MNQTPSLWTLKSLVEYVNRGEISSSNDGKSYVPARPMGFWPFPERVRIALLVFRGKADAVVWPQDQ